jgi:hypothetical protein
VLITSASRAYCAAPPTAPAGSDGNVGAHLCSYFIAIAPAVSPNCSVPALAAARVRRDQLRGQPDSSTPVLPIAALASSAIGAIMIVCAIAAVLISDGRNGMQPAEDEQFPLTPAAVVAGVGIVIEAGSFILSLIALFAVRRWKPASICALLMSGTVVGLVALLVALAG